MSSLLSMAMEAAEASPKVGLESIDSQNDSEVEIEYGFFIELTKEQFNELVNILKGHATVTFAECKFDSDSNSRVRHYIEHSDGTPPHYELTTKVKTDGKTNIEYNDVISDPNYKAIESIATSKAVRTRVYVPYKDAEGNAVTRKSGDPLTWEVDLYIDTRTIEALSNKHIHPWIKLELEVDRAGLDITIVKELIPFKYNTIINMDSKDPIERAFIANLYNSEYNFK